MDLHLERLRESVSWGRNVAEETMANMTAAFAARGSDAALAATKQMALMVRRQAEVMALADVFLAVTVDLRGDRCGSRADAPAAGGGRRRRRALAPGKPGAFVRSAASM